MTVLRTLAPPSIPTAKTLPAFSSGQALSRELSRRLNAAGLGYFKFNNRGHDVVAGHGKLLAGAAFERFGHSVEDIRELMSGNLCRCGAYVNIVAAIKEVLEARA